VGATKSSKSTAAPAATKYLQNCNGISTDHKIMHILFVVLVKCKKTSTHTLALALAPTLLGKSWLGMDKVY